MFLSLSLSLSLFLHTHTHLCTSLFLSFFLTHSLSLSLSLSLHTHTHTNTYTHSLSLSHTHTLSLFLQDYPSVGQITQMLEENEVAIIFAIEPTRLQTYTVRSCPSLNIKGAFSFQYMYMLLWTTYSLKGHPHFGIFTRNVLLFVLPCGRIWQR